VYENFTFSQLDIRDGCDYYNAFFFLSLLLLMNAYDVNLINIVILLNRQAVHACHF
jgi:hypothetical protein